MCDELPVADWRDLAWQLWRYRHLTFVGIRDRLALEGWCVHPLLIEAAVCERVGALWRRCELDAGVTPRPAPPPGAEAS